MKRSYGWAAGEVLAINNVAGLTAEYVRNVDWSEVNPRSWWANIKAGFPYDSDKFKTNQWVHPFNGAAFYNSSRANGLGFWPSAGFALAGAFEWECCGETGPMSFNDMFATTLGGIALGESQYRLSSEILNNQSSGMGRFWREFGAFFVDPVRGFNRLVSGDAKKVADNPVDPMDWRPPGGATFVATGVRSIGEGSSITNNTKSYATILLNHNYGDVFDTTRRKPFDFIDFVAELNFGEKVGLGNVQIRGNLASWPLGSSHDHVFALVQHFDYMNNTAYEFGGQSVGGALSSRFRLSNKARPQDAAGRRRDPARRGELGVREVRRGRRRGARPRVRLRPGPRGVRQGGPRPVRPPAPERALPLRLDQRHQRLGLQRGHGRLGRRPLHPDRRAAARDPDQGRPRHRRRRVRVPARQPLLADGLGHRASSVAQHIRQRNPQARVYLAISH